MGHFKRIATIARLWRQAIADSGTVFCRDVGHGMLEVSHNALALVGLVVVAVGLFAGGLTDLRHSLESQAYTWLQTRQEARALAANGSQGSAVLAGDRDAISRATASDPKDLNRQQAAVAFWLARRYRVAVEPMSRLVQEAWDVGHGASIDPTLILAVMAVESSFNPFAQSNVGAQGLMQVMTKIHDDKYVAFGGSHAAFDPVTNLRVGVQVLKECITRAGSVEAGLRFYVGAANTGDDGGYAAKVLAQQGLLRQIAAGTLRHPAPRPAAAPAPAPAAPALRAVAPPPPALPDQIALLP